LPLTVNAAGPGPRIVTRLATVSGPWSKVIAAGDGEADGIAVGGDGQRRAQGAGAAVRLSGDDDGRSQTDGRCAEQRQTGGEQAAGRLRFGFHKYCSSVVWSWWEAQTGRPREEGGMRMQTAAGEAGKSGAGGPQPKTPGAGAARGCNPPG